MKKQEEFKIFSDLDLEREFESISSQLLEIKTDWNLRIKALKRMQALITSDYIAFENFPTLFLKFTAPLSVQLQDLRSAVVKEASSTIVLAASVLGDSFELCAERLSDVLFKLINSGNKILAEAGSECFFEIIKSVITWRLIPKTLEQFSSKNPNIRVKACMFLQTMLEIYPIEVFEYAASNKAGFLEKLEQGLKQAVHDASNDTRSYARKAFLNYRVFFPARANKLFQTFDSSTQRAFGELTENKASNVTPSRSISANSNRMATSATKIENKSQEKKSRNSLNEVRDLSSTGGTTPEVRTVKETKSLEKKEKDKEKEKESPGLDVWIHITNDANWEARVMAFDNIKKNVVEELYMRQLNSSKVLWDQMINAHLDQMMVSNFRVVAACLGSLNVITETYPEKISLSLEKILPRLLVCLSSSKENVLLGAKQLLDIIIDIYIPEDLLALLLKYSTQEVKTNTFPVFAEVVFKLAESSTEFFLLSQNVRVYLQKMIVVLKEVPKQNVKGLVAAFELALERNRKDTVTFLMDLNPPDLSILRSALQEFKSPMDLVFKDTTKETVRPAPQLEARRVPDRPPAEIKSVSQDFKPAQEKPVFGEKTSQNFKNPVQEKPVSQDLNFKPQKELKTEAKITVVHTEIKALPQEVKKIEKKPTVQTDVKKNKEEVKSVSPGSRQENLKRVKSLNDELENLEFDRCFKEILNILELCIEDPSLIEASVSTFQQILQKRKAICLNYISDCLNIMSRGFYLDSRHLLQATEEALEDFLLDQSSSVTVPLIIQSIKLNEVPAIQAFIRILTKIVTSSKINQLLGLMRTIINQMKESLNHSNADVRKSVVFCLVEVQAVIGDDFNAYLEELTPSQQKLVTIYIQRRQAS